MKIDDIEEIHRILALRYKYIHIGLYGSEQNICTEFQNMYLLFMYLFIVYLTTLSLVQTM
jgi:hypothetical protein